VPVCLVLMALPLLIPWNVVGAMWNIFALPDIGLLGLLLNALGFDYNITQDPAPPGSRMILMDVWHWTSLVVLLAYAGLVSIPDAYYQAAKIDGASLGVFRYIQLPKMKRVLTIASCCASWTASTSTPNLRADRRRARATRPRCCRSTW
jgi:glycerol transport system permease protein